MTDNDQTIEQQIQSKGLTAPRITPDDIEACIASEHYFTAFDGCVCPGENNPGENNKWAQDWEVTRSIEALDLLTFCVLVLRNSFTITGESACASPENFDPEIGRQIARSKAKEKIWLLEGYLLRQRLHDQTE